ncbi:MAG: PstS family phosphate ABC transporter substrate-binding protein [Halobacteriota archaeon]
MGRRSGGTSTVGVRRRHLLASLGMAGLAGCVGVFGRDEDEVTMSGSSTVFPVAEAIGASFSRANPGITISISQTGSGGGFSNFFCPGMTDINNASRSVDETEVEQCTSNGVTPIEFQVATDALTVVVNPDADWIECLSVAELREIWRSDGAERWSDVRADWPDEPFELYGADTTSGTFDYFVEAIIGEDATHRSDYYATERDRIVVQGVRGSPYTMGYFGFAYYSENPDQITAVAIDDGDGCTLPSLETAMTGEYTPLSRPLFTYVAKESLRRPSVQRFVRYYLEQAATDAVSDVGYVPVTEEVRDDNLERLDAAIAEVTA